jgi:hypothetical protein
MNPASNSLHDRLNAEFAQAWKPDPGDVLVGEVIELSERDGGYGSYPIVTVRQDNGEEAAFHAYHTVAASQLAEQRPAIGERVGIKYRGRVKGDGPHGPYHSYTVKVDRPAERKRLGDERRSFEMRRKREDATLAEVWKAIEAYHPRAIG